MQLSERAIKSLENISHKPGRCFNKCRSVCTTEAGVIHIQGQQSSRNYGVTSANGSKESSTVYTGSLLSPLKWSSGQEENT